jgi:hypothetical protein
MVLGEGRSDWKVPPPCGLNSGQDPPASVLLAALLGMIAGESRRAAGIDAGKLEAWWRRRHADLQAGRLGLSARNLDFLAQRDNMP